MAGVSLVQTLYAILTRKYPDAPPEQVLMAATNAVTGARFMDVDRTDPIVLVTAEHDLRLALGLEVDAARTDPEYHRPAGPRGYEVSQTGNNDVET